MRKILFLQNSPDRYPVSRLDQRFAAAGFEVDHYWAYKEQFPDSLERYHGAFISGSPHGAYEDIPFIRREHELINAIAEVRLPTLGICFGSQILASALCGQDQVFRRSFCEVGYKWLAMAAEHESDALTAGLSDKLYLFVWHNDEVKATHPDMRILASTELCPNQIWRYRDLPIWGIQGHPEIDREQARVWFEQNRARLERDGADVEALLEQADDTVDAKSMIANFLRACAG